MSSIPRQVYTPPSLLTRTRTTLARYAVLTSKELEQALWLLAPLKSQDQATQDLQKRGLWPWEGIQVGKLRAAFKARDGRTLAHPGALGLLLTGPDGQPWGLKIRNSGSKEELKAARLERYVYRIAGHGAPAWCSPGYGQGREAFIVEGEFNGAAAARALGAIGLPIDVQGLAGASGLPHLAGMAGKPVYIYGDGDMAGLAGAKRVAQIAQAAGAAEVRMLAPLPEGDFCDLAGAHGMNRLGQELRALLDAATIHHTVSPSGESAGAAVAAKLAPSHQTLGDGALVQYSAEAAALEKYRAKLKKYGRRL